MKVPFTATDVSKLFAYALDQRLLEATTLALKVAQAVQADRSTLLSSAIENSNQLHWALANGITQFARHDQLELIIELLKSPSEKVQSTAILALQMLKDPRALKPLEKLLQESGSATIREKALQAAQKIQEHPVRLKENTFYTYQQLTPLTEEDLAFANYILGYGLSKTKVPVLVQLLFHRIDDVVREARKELSRLEERESDAIIDAVVSMNLPVTQALVEVLGHFKNPRGADLIIAYAKNKNGYSDSRMLEILSKIGGEKVSQFLAETIIKSVGSAYDQIKALKKFDKLPITYLVSEYQSNFYFRRTGAEKLAAILGVQALPVLLEGIQDRYREVRQNAGLGLIQVGKPVTEQLIALLNGCNDEELRIHYYQTLGKIGDERALFTFEELTQSKNVALLKVALKGIGNIKNGKSVQILANWVKSPDPIIRKLVVKGLRGQYHVEAVELLIGSVKDNNQEVRLEVIQSLYDAAREVPGAYSKIIAALLLLLEDKDKAVANLAEETIVDLNRMDETLLQKIKILRKGVKNPIRTEHLLKRIETPERREIGIACMEGSLFGRTTDIEGPPPTTKIPGPITDSIQLAVSAPRVVCAGSSFILDVWAYFDSYKDEILGLARQAQRDRAIALRTKGPVRVQRDTALTVQVTIPDFGVEQVDTIYWGGTTGNCTFPVKVPNTVGLGYYLGKANFYVGALLIAKLNFDLEVGQQQKEEADITTKEQRIRTAFASYASDDRNQVLGRIQGMFKLLPDLDIFLDVASLRSGEHWERRLEEEIKIRDVFYLFWSEAARKSPWVEKEWRTALSTKGIDCIDPVPLEPPDKVPPPPELSSLHFNEWTFAFVK